jgi:hypothetical protein
LIVSSVLVDAKLEQNIRTLMQYGANMETWEHVVDRIGRELIVANNSRGMLPYDGA